MKPLAVALAASLAINAALCVVFVAKPALAPPALRDFFGAQPSVPERTVTAASPERVGSGSPRSKAAPGSVWSLFDTDDLPALVQRLKAAGFSPRLIRSIINAKVQAQTAGRLRALQTQNTEFWKPEARVSNSATASQYSQILRDRTKLLRELLGGPEFGASVDVARSLTQQYGDLPPQKVELLQRINEDYADMMAQVRNGTGGITLPEDTEQLALLEREKRADLVALLTPQELEDYDMRTSPVTSRLRQAMAIMDATETEFRTIYGIHQSHADVLYPGAAARGGPAPATAALSRFEERRGAEDELASQIRAALGEQRATEYFRASSSEFQQLRRLTQRENLPPEAAIRAYDLRDATAKQSMAIFEDPGLSTDQKRATLQALADSTSSQIVAALGENAGRAYVASASWLSRIRTGGAVTFGQNSTTFRSLPSANTQPRPPVPGP